MSDDRVSWPVSKRFIKQTFCAFVHGCGIDGLWNSVREEEGDNNSEDGEILHLWYQRLEGDGDWLCVSSLLLDDGLGRDGKVYEFILYLCERRIEQQGRGKVNRCTYKRMF